MKRGGKISWDVKGTMKPNQHAGAELGQNLSLGPLYRKKIRQLDWVFVAIANHLKNLAQRLGIRAMKN